MEMKKLFLIYILLIVSCVAFVLPASAQRFVGYVAAGANFAQVEGDDQQGFTKVGVNAGLGLKLPLNRKQNMSLLLELLYSQKGSYHKAVPNNFFDTIAGAQIDPTVPFKRIFYRITLDYVEVPLMFRYEDFRSGLSISAGVAWSRLVRAREIYKGYTYTTNLRSGTYNKNDWSGLIDVDIRLYKNLSLGIRWEMSLVPIREMQVGFYYNGADTEWEWRRMRNHVLSARLCYYINEKYVKNTKTNNKGERIGTPWIREIPDYD